MDKEILALVTVGIVAIGVAMAISSQIGGSVKKTVEKKDIPVPEDDDFLNDQYEFGDC